MSTQFEALTSKPTSQVQEEPIYVGDLDHDITESDLLQFFSSHIQVARISLLQDKDIKKKGFAYIYFDNTNNKPNLAEEIIEKFNGQKIKNTKIRVSKYKKQVERDPLANIFVKNIHNNLNEQILNDYFKKFGTIESFKINQAGQEYNTAYIQYKEKQSAEDCLKTPQHNIQNHQVTVERFLPSKDRQVFIDKRTLYLKNLPSDVNVEILKKRIQEKFPQFGEVSEIVTRLAKDNDKVKYGLVSYDKKIDTDLFDTNAQTIKINDSDSVSIEISRPSAKNEEEQSKQSLYLKNLREDISRQEILDVFGKFGDLISLSTRQNPEFKTKFAQITFTNEQSAENTLICADKDEQVKKLFNEKKIYIAFNQTKAQRKPYLESKQKQIIHMQQEQQQQQMLQPMSAFSYPQMAMDGGRFGMMPNYSGFQFYPPMQQQMYFPNQFQGYQAQQNFYNNGYQSNIQYNRPNNNRNYQPKNRNYSDNTNYYNNNNSGYQQKSRSYGNQGHNSYNRYNKSNGQQTYVKAQSNEAKRSNDNQVLDKKEQPVQQPQIETKSDEIDRQATIRKYEQLIQTPEGKRRTWEELGKLIYPKVAKHTNDDHELTKKITGMMVDLELLSIEEIVDFIVDPELLKEQVLDCIQDIKGISSN